MSMLNCFSGENCIVNVKTRKLCPKCRLLKCLSSGMKTELMRSLAENEKRKQTKERNKRQKLNANSTTSSSDGPQEVADNENKCPEIDNLIRDPLNITDDELIQQVMDIKNMSNCISSIGDYTTQPIVRVITDYEGINRLECSRINELLNASSVFSHIIHSDSIGYQNEHGQIFSAQQTDSRVNEVVNFTKRLEGFTKCCADDQLSLVKYGCLELIFMRGINISHNLAHCLDIHLKLIQDSERDVYLLFKKFVDKFIDNFDDDVVIVNLLRLSYLTPNANSNNNCIYIYCKDIYY
ncbi:unnamed protein product [Medioppia subpectinata]|uniref:Nuclear receptor domain-containing protein n=1 Tax=Medioppia subpectinata TaxID=1979941 RepID=A0A7R9Q5F1_9ACAR|nr:unnamed protein product [Medioppia subpectinata]CAG2113250.1 unnamed protein product [Medioppia subpectinata]